MKKEKFTPGPWRFKAGRWNTVSKDNKAYSRGSILAPNPTGSDWYIARVDDAPDEVANAHLIAAAPEMYAALERITRACYACESMAVRRARLHATAVLAKARGEA